MLAVALSVWRRHRQETRYATTQGIVEKIDPDSSGEFVTVQYSPDGQLMFGGQPVRFRTGSSTGEHHVGKAVTVHYDPQRPERANLRGAGILSGVAMTLAVCALPTFPIAAMLLLWLGPLQADRDSALDSFVEASRARDAARMNALSAAGAQVSPEFVERAARSGAYRLGSNNIGFSNDACIEVIFDADSAPHYVYMQKPSDWRIVRANANDPYCIEDLDD